MKYTNCTIVQLQFLVNTTKEIPFGVKILKNVFVQIDYKNQCTTTKQKKTRSWMSESDFNRWL